MKVFLPVLCLTLLGASAFAQSSALDKKPRSAAKMASDGIDPFAKKPKPMPTGNVRVDWQRAAAEKHPDLGVAGSALNVAFVDENRARRETDPGFFKEEDWPVRLADEVAAQLDAEKEAATLGLPPGNRQLARDYVSLHRSVASWPQRKLTWPKSDREIGDLLSLGATTFLELARNGDAPRATKALATFREMLQTIFKTKQMVGLKFNEFTRTELEESVGFDLYKDSNDFYVEIGAGSFRTLGILSLDEIEDLLEAGMKARDWVSQCEKEKLETTKQIGQWGGVEMEFCSTDGGTQSWVWLDVRGAVTADRLLSHSRVRLSTLNFQCLLHRIAAAPELIERRQRERANAAKLK